MARPEIEIRANDDHSIDEIVTNKKQHIHIERMSDGYIWMGIGGKSFNFYVHKGKLMLQEQYQ